MLAAVFCSVGETTIAAGVPSVLRSPRTVAWHACVGHGAGRLSADRADRAVGRQVRGLAFGMRRAVHLRLLTLLFAVLHLVAPPLASVADALVERQSAAAARGVAHVEPAGGTESCPHVHAVDCGFCHALASLAEPAAAPRTALPSAIETVATVGAEGTVHARDRPTAARPRAPPAS